MTDDNLIQIDDRTTIPVSELKFLFSTSSGPGGQHANRSATRVTLLFDVSTSPSLGERARQRLLENLAHRLDKQGVLRIQVQDSRSQVQNRHILAVRFKIGKLPFHV
jgi:ribosome-associated protein